jgi:predicted O-methyltransferase YrrM
MNEILDEIFKTKTVKDGINEIHKLHSNISEAQGYFLQGILKEIKPKATLEIGLAYGISSLFLLEILKEQGNKNKSHIIFDPFAELYWENIGLENIRRSGYENLIDFRYLPSDEGLIQLINEKKRIQFAYVDSTKIFDILFLDFCLINKILDIGGIIVFDDCGFPGIKKLVRLISKMPFYKIHNTHFEEPETFKKSSVKKFMSFFMGHFPFKNVIFPGIDFNTDLAKGLNFHCIAFQKTGEDKREWDWYADF